MRYMRGLSSVEEKRIAMKGLFNLATKSKEYKVKIISELSHEFELIRDNKLDEVVKSYIITLLRTN